jgi:hypothetical protein
MKLKCISNVERKGWSTPHDQKDRLTVDKVYTGQFLDDYNSIIVFDDKKEWVAFEKGLFVPAEE